MSQPKVNTHSLTVFTFEKVKASAKHFSVFKGWLLRKNHCPKK